MKHYIILFLLAAFALSGCESDMVATSNNNTTDTIKKELVVVPTSITTERYKEFSLKARITNVPLSDVYFHVDFGDGRWAQTVGGGNNATHFYIDSGHFTITIKAYDGFTDSLLGTTTIPAIVGEITPSINFTHGDIDTTLQLTTSTYPDIYFRVESNVPNAIIAFDYGDNTSDSTTLGFCSHGYESAGTYTVIARVYSDNGIFQTSDTLSCTIHRPKLTFDYLAQFGNMYYTLSLDNSSSIYTKVDSFNPIEYVFSLSYTTGVIAKWENNSLQYSHYYVGADSSIVNFNNESAHVIFSSDMNKIESVKINFYDSTTWGGNTYYTQYAFKATDLEYLGRDATHIIYRVVLKPTSEYVSEEYFRTSSMSYDKVGGPSYKTTKNYIGEARKGPYAYIIFAP